MLIARWRRLGDRPFDNNNNHCCRCYLCQFGANKFANPSASLIVLAMYTTCPWIWILYYHTIFHTVLIRLQFSDRLRVYQSTTCDYFVCSATFVASHIMPLELPSLMRAWTKNEAIQSRFMNALILVVAYSLLSRSSPIYSFSSSSVFGMTIKFMYEPWIMMPSCLRSWTGRSTVE